MSLRLISLCVSVLKFQLRRAILAEEDGDSLVCCLFELSTRQQAVVVIPAGANCPDPGRELKFMPWLAGLVSKDLDESVTFCNEAGEFFEIF